MLRLVGLVVATHSLTVEALKDVVFFDWGLPRAGVVVYHMAEGSVPPLASAADGRAVVAVVFLLPADSFLRLSRKQACACDAGRRSMGLGRFTIALKRAKPIIGLTGGIGAGKTMVAGLFESLGAAVIDSDRNAHRELAMSDVAATLRSWWGERVVKEDGTVDRSAIGDIVFSSPRQLQRLETFLYPRMAKRRAALIAEFMVDPAVLAVVLDSPKLFEAGLDRECDALVFVESDRRTRLRRVARSRGWTDDEVSRREKSQISLDLKRAKSDYTVVNNAGADALAPQIENAFADILHRYSQ